MKDQMFSWLYNYDYDYMTQTWTQGHLWQQSYLGEHARPYKESIYEEMVAGQEARRQASVEAEKEIMRQKEKKEEEQRTVMREEVARLVLIESDVFS